MPWLVFLFGLMIAPSGVISIFFIIIQPIEIGTWSTLALIGAAAMLIQIPYSLDELLAVVQFLRRRVKAGKNLLRVFLFGDTDDGDKAASVADEFDRTPGTIVADTFSGGLRLPWDLGLAAAIGLSLLFTRLTFGAEPAMANWDHVIGSLVLTTISIGGRSRATCALPSHPAGDRTVRRPLHQRCRHRAHGGKHPVRRRPRPAQPQARPCAVPLWELGPRHHLSSKSRAVLAGATRS